jgi:NDP-sugar pyrophosphorylase family protein
VFDRPGGEISAFNGRAEAGQELAAFSGIHVLSEPLLDALPFEPGARACIVHDGYRPLLGEGRIRGLLQKGFWADLGTPEDYLSTHLLALGRGLPDQEEIRYEQPRERVWVRRGARIDPSVRLEPPVVIGRGVRIEAGATVGPGVVLGDEAVVEAGSRLRATVVFPGVHVVGKHVHEILFESPAMKYHEGVHDNPEGGTS